MRQVETATSPRLWQPVRALTGSLTLDATVALPVLALRPGGQIRGETVNSLSPLPPERHFRELILLGARRFVAELAQKRERYRLITPEAELKVYGPYMHKDREGAGSFQGAEWVHPEALDFHLVGDFVAEFGHLVPDIQPEERRLVQTTTVAEWQRAEDAARARMGR